LPPKAARNDKEDRLFVSLKVTEKDNTPYQSTLDKGISAEAPLIRGDGGLAF
jgi:hypothetical protein